MNILFIGYVNNWPFIFKDFENAGYTTLLGEDTPTLAAFNYRLRGFNAPPTDKYLRPFWIGADAYIRKLNQKSYRCNHQLHMLYLKRFLKNYKDKPTFSYLLHTKVSHNSSPLVAIADNDLVELLDHLGKTGLIQNTLLIVFGDHGDRTSNFRSTLVGKLESRLPFMSFTFPPWFSKKFPKEFKNFKQNSNHLTSHFDIHATLQHLLTFPNNKIAKNKFGTSLFEDLAPLNRTCSDAGILEHWCSCQNYQKLKVDNRLVLKAARTTIDYINSKNENIKMARENCEKLTLNKIIRAGIVAPNERVQKFKNTFKTEKCDGCGTYEFDVVNFNTANYEIVFTVLPSNGEYEATVALDIKEGNFIVGDGISRTNLYRNQPHCVAKEYPHLRPFCYCKSQIIY